MKSGLRARVERLEERLEAHDKLLLVIIRDFAEGEILGYRNAPYGCETIDTLRLSGEAEADCRDRAVAAVHALARGTVVVLEELRG